MAMRTLNGGPAETIYLEGITADELENLWKAIVKATKNGDIINMASSGPSDGSLNANGLV